MSTDDTVLAIAGETAKTALNPYKWFVGIAVVVALLGGFFWVRHSLIQQGVDKAKTAGVTQELNDVRAINAADARSNDEIQKDNRDFEDMQRRIRDLERMRTADAKRVPELIRRAAEAAVREYAAQADRDIAVVEGQRDGFAAEAMQASGAAWGIADTMQARRDAIAAQRSALRPIQPNQE